MKKTCVCGLTFIGRWISVRYDEHTWECRHPKFVEIRKTLGMQ